MTPEPPEKTIVWGGEGCAAGAHGGVGAEFHLHGERASESPLEVFTPSPALPPQWSREITARGLDQSAETRCGEILIEPSTRPRG